MIGSALDVVDQEGFFTFIKTVRAKQFIRCIISLSQGFIVVCPCFL